MRVNDHFEGSLEIGKVEKRFSFQPHYVVTSLLSGCIVGIACIAGASMLSKMIRGYSWLYSNSLSPLRTVLILVGIWEIAEGIIEAYAQTQTYLDVGAKGVRGKGWNKLVRFLPSMPKTFQIPYADIIRTEMPSKFRSQYLKITTKQGLDFIVQIRDCAEAAELMNRLSSSSKNAL